MPGRTVTEDLMQGCMDNIPCMPSSAIRVFFSSTFTDMTEERNLVMRTVVPEIKSFCQDKDLTFEVVDMRWGVREDAYADHQTCDLCIAEIEKSERASLGPNFVVFVGDKYGSRPLPSAIPVTEFRLFRRIASWMDIKFETVEKWYLLDTNSVPPVYQIQPITTLLPYFNNMNPVNKTKRLVHVQNWESDERNMKNVFRKVSVIALDQKKITRAACEKYFISVTECEVDKGIYTYSKLKDRTLCFERTLTSINIEDSIAKRFIDLSPDGEIDPEARDLREKMKSEKLRDCLPESQRVQDTVCWSDKGIDPENPEHAHYLETFCETFKKLLLEQIKLAIRETAEDKIENALSAEVVRHMMHCKLRSQCFFGQGEVINQTYKMLHKIFRIKGMGQEEEEEDQEKEENPVEKSDEKEESMDENANEEDNKNDEDVVNESNEEQNNLSVRSNNVEEDVRDDDESKLKEDENDTDADKDIQDKEQDEDDDEQKPEQTEHEKKVQEIIASVTAHYERLGERAPTFSIGDLADDTASDPTRDMKQELITFDMTKRYRRPVVVTGEDGCGKTTIVATMARLLKTWHPPAVLLIRFLGSTARSDNVRSLLINLIENIWSAYNMIRPTDIDFAEDVIYLGQYLQALMWKVSCESKPLYILLDSLDFLQPGEQAHGLAWLPTTLPLHCGVLVTVAKTSQGCLKSARRILPFEALFIEIPPLSEEAADKVVSATLNRNSRELARPQRNFLLEKYREWPNPLYLKLITDLSMSWRSHQQVKDLILGSNTEHAVIHLFMLTERNHGIVLVSKAFGLLSCMKRGILYQEMEDMLSLADDVLHDTYIHHLPPDPELIRLPGSILSRVHSDISEYLAMADDGFGSLISWYHPQFKEIAKERYVTDELRRPLHRLAAQYFMGFWHQKVKPLRLDKVKTGWYPDNTRGVPEQSLYLKNGKANVRKLVELPHHLAWAGMWKDFHREIVCNVEWLVAKVKHVGVTDLKADLMMMLKHRASLSEEDDVDEVDLSPEEEEEKKNAEAALEAKPADEETEEDQQAEEEKRPEDEILFLTESGKQDPTVKEEEVVEEEKEEDQSVSTITEAEYVPDLVTALKDVEILLDIINLGIDSIRHDAYSLPAQIICHLGKDRPTSPGLRKLVTDSYRWISDNPMQMFCPVDACLAPPGEMLQSTFNIDVVLPDSDREHDYPIELDADENQLFVIQQNVRRTDTLIVLDLSQGGERVMIEDTKAYVHSFRLNGNKKFLILCVYKSLDSFNPSYKYKLYDVGQFSSYFLEKEASSMDVTNNGDIVAYADERTCYICSPKREERSLEIIYRLHHTETITNIRFSPDAYYLLTFNPEDAFRVWVPRRGECTFAVEADQKKKSRFSLTETSGKVVHITANQRLLQVMSDVKQKSTLKIHDLSTGNVLHELSSPELSHFYQIDSLDLDEGEEFVLVSTQQVEVVGGNRSKSALLWDVETGKLVSRVGSEKPFDATKVLISNNIVYILACFFKDTNVYVYSVGPRHRMLAGAKPIRKIDRHSKSVLQLLLCFSDTEAGGSDRLISVGADNSIKIWDLDQVLKPESKTKKVDIGASTCLAYTKECDAVFFATDKGFIVRHSCKDDCERKTLTSELEGAVHIMLMSKNGRYLIAAVGNMIYVYYHETGELEYSLESCCAGKISCMAENNNVLIAGHSGMEGKGRIWDLSNGRALKDVSYLYSFYETAVNPRGTQFGITMFEYPIMIDVFGSGAEPSNISMEQVDSMMSPCTHLAFSHDGAMLASASKDGRIRVIDTETGRYLHTMMQQSCITAMLFSWDNQLLYTAGYRSVYLWCIGPEHSPEKQGSLEVKLTRHANFITCMQLLRDDRYLVTASLDKTIVLWSLKTRTAICSFRTHNPVDTMKVAADLSSISYIPDRSSNVAVLMLNKTGQEVLSGVPKVPVPPKVKKAQSVAFTFSSQQVTTKTSTACSIL
ncbi:uncharacterized protein LOC101864694 [Aplysia californica]|uniref:Uncharacterized protein LOC101864694 n=1 Tax=Aplysia californica TaxID=6500 RepID=A0ABM0JUF4_APLCA|nr:uncharacterized protein LOC101864694 [Aplysia californica]